MTLALAVALTVAEKSQYLCSHQQSYMPSSIHACKLLYNYHYIRSRRNMSEDWALRRLSCCTSC